MAEKDGHTRQVRMREDVLADLDGLKQNEFEPYWHVVWRLLRMRPCSHGRNES